jgi:hypothetical protein
LRTGPHRAMPRAHFLLLHAVATAIRAAHSGASPAPRHPLPSAA